MKVNHLHLMVPAAGAFFEKYFDLRKILVEVGA
jgi:hypothetical protein